MVNYDLGTLDVFINGVLEGSYKQEIQLMEDREILIGQDEGISGGICNILYFPSAMQKSQIEFSYNALKFKNPPII